MVINIGPENAQYNTKIPSIDDNADIQDAFKLYHYGEDSNGIGELNQNSIAGYLKGLEDGKVSKSPIILPINSDLNNYTQTGFYVQDTDAKAVTGINYPRVPLTLREDLRRPRAGFLMVVNDGFNIAQTYQVVGDQTNRAFWRSFFGNVGWTQWQTFSVEGHVHDDRYYTKAQSDNLYLSAIRYLTLRRPTLSAANSQYTLVLNDQESRLIIMDNLSLPNSVLIPTNASVPFVVGTQITVMQGNTGQTSILGAPGVVVNATPTNRLRARWSSASLIKINTNEWVAVGDFA